MPLSRRSSTRSSPTVYSIEVTEKLKLLDITKKEVERMVDELERFVKGLNEDNSANQFEKPGEAIRDYGRTCPGETVRADFEIMKKCFDEIGRLHRLFSNEIEERCISPMKEWIKSDYKRMKEDVERLNVLRKQMDRMSNEARTQPGNAVLKQKHSEAEGAHHAQMGLLEERVFNKLEDDHSRLARKWKIFMEIEANLYRDVRDVIQDALNRMQA